MRILLLTLLATVALAVYSDVNSLNRDQQELVKMSDGCERIYKSRVKKIERTGDHDWRCICGQ
jgi:hypothetical protein